MPLWVVIGPEYGEVVPVTDEGQGPIEYTCDVVEVGAETRRDALVLGVRLLRDQPYLQGDPDENPFTGVKVEQVSACPHGVLTNGSFRCQRCYAEWTAQDTILGVL